MKRDSQRISQFIIIPRPMVAKVNNKWTISK